MAATLTDTLEVTDVTIQEGESVTVRLSNQPDGIVFEVWADGRVEVWTDGGRELQGTVNALVALLTPAL